MQKIGTLVIISSPSGGGKDTVIAELIKIFPGSARLITTTTRPLRPGDVNGVNYTFVTPAEFENKIKAGVFYEYNDYVGNYYGTEKQVLDDLLSQHDLVFTNIDVHGKANFDKTNVPHLSIFLYPESIEVLYERIRNRGGLTANVIAERLKTAEHEITQSQTYDYKVVNFEGKLPETVAKVSQIIREWQSRHSA